MSDGILRGKFSETLQLDFQANDGHDWMFRYRLENNSKKLSFSSLRAVQVSLCSPTSINSYKLVEKITS